MDDFGRSPEISKKILKCVQYGYVNSVSVIVGKIKKKLHISLKKSSIKTRLHLNLTENIIKPNIKKYTFFKLLFLNKLEQEKIKKEINNQVDEYIKIYGKKNFRIDGHEHVHVIPWIYKYLINLKKIKIKEIRVPNEEIKFFDYWCFLKLKFYRNLIALIVLKLLIFTSNIKKNKLIFFGLLYSGLYNKKILLNNLEYISNNYKKKYDYEILIYGGHTNAKEKKEFEEQYYRVYSSVENKDQYKLAFNKKLFNNFF